MLVANLLEEAPAKGEYCGSDQYHSKPIERVLDM
jgi:hypothetical protein